MSRSVTRSNLFINAASRSNWSSSTFPSCRLVAWLHPNVDPTLRMGCDGYRGVIR